MSYLDETSKADALAEARKVGYDAVQHGKSVVQENGIDYLTKEEKGKTRAYGFLRDDVTAIGGNYAHLMDNDARVIACHRAWMHRLDEHPGVKKSAHKYVLSLDPRFCELMAAAGKDTDALLVQGVRTVMRRYQEKFYPGDRLGYLVGIHHDRKHVHAHVMLFPFTERGQNLHVSDSKERKSLTEQRNEANNFIRKYFFTEFDNPIKASERPVDKVMQSRMVSYIAWTSFPKGTIDEDQKTQWVVGEKKRLLALPEADLREVLVKRIETYGVAYEGMVARVHGKPEELKTLFQNIGRQRVDFKLKVKQSEVVIKEIKDRQQTNRVEFNKAQQAMSNFRFFAAQARGHSVSIYESGTPEQRKWLTDMLSNPTLAETARVTMTKQPLQEIIGNMQNRGMANDRLLGEEKNVDRENSDLLRAVFNLRLEELKAEREKIKAELDRAYVQREGVMTALDTVKVTESMVTAAGKGRKPVFLEQFEGLKRAGTEFPILCRTVGPEDLVAGRGAEPGELCDAAAVTRLLLNKPLGDGRG